MISVRQQGDCHHRCFAAGQLTISGRPFIQLLFLPCTQFSSINHHTMKAMHEIEPVDIFSGDIVEAGMVKSLLENAEIPAYFKDEIMGTLVPWLTDQGVAGSVRILVSSQDAEKAKLIVEEYKKNSSE